MPKILGIDYDYDYRGRLATNGAGGPWESMSLGNKRGVVIHYAGGAQNRTISALARFQAYARWHVRPGGFSGYTGNGIMYHAGVDEQGGTSALYDARVARWHAGSGTHNRFYISINIPIGGNQVATPAQKVALDELIHQYIKAGVGQNVSTVIGHQEASWSLCPGTLQSNFVSRLRSGHRFSQSEPDPVKDKPVKIPEADHIIIDVPGMDKFWIIQDIYKRYAMVDEPLFLFGYPIEGMRGDPPYQNFERARLHVDPGSWPERHNVQLAHVGSELCEKKYGPAFRNKRGVFVVDDEVDNNNSRRYFKETGYVVEGDFLKFWNKWNGAEYFGLPISRVFQEDGMTMQYFERARFELHPDSEWHKDYFRTGLGRVNAELLDK